MKPVYVLFVALAWSLFSGVAPLRAVAPDESLYLSTQDALFHQADQLEQNHRFQEAISIYEKLLQSGNGRDSRWTAQVLFRLGCAHYQSGERLSALESVNVAVTLDPGEPSYKIFQSELMADQPSGRRRSSVYHARRDQGSARRLVSKQGVLHIFVRGRNTEAWDPEDEDRTRQNILESDQWLQARSAESKVALQPVFEHRFLTLTDEPFWRRIDVPHLESSRDYRKAWLDAVLARFQATTYAELFDRVFEGMDLDNRSVVFHTSLRDISFAVFVPYQPEPTDLESTFVPYEASNRSNFYGSVSYTHEFLHLYGADDLFNKVQDPEAPDADVMSFGAHRLEECRMGGLTRYAVGWADTPPRLTSLRMEQPVSRLKRKRGAHS